MKLRSPRRRSRALVAMAIAATAALVLAGCSGKPTDPNAPFYEGKTITLYVPYAPGGGTDLAARAFAPLLEKHIAGNPTVIVENDPSTGGIVGANEFASSGEKDGLKILV